MNQKIHTIFKFDLGVWFMVTNRYVLLTLIYLLLLVYTLESSWSCKKEKDKRKLYNIDICNKKRVVLNACFLFFLILIFRDESATKFQKS